MRNGNMGTNKCATSSDSLKDNVFNHIYVKMYPQSLQNKLDELYILKLNNNKSFYFIKLMNLKYRKSTSIANHLNKMQEYMDQLLEMGMKDNNEMLTLMLLVSLPESWETLKVPLINSILKGTIRANYVKSEIFE